MARTSIDVNRERLVRCIREAEVAGSLPNLSALWTKVTELYNTNFEAKITASVVMLRAKDWNLTYQTKAGKKGRQAGVALSDEQKAAMVAGRRNRGEKFAGDPEIVEGWKALRLQASSAAREMGSDPTRWDSLMNRVEKGSLKAATTMKCLECCNFQTAEVRLCVCKDCPLWAHRPYKGGSADDENESGTDEVDEAEETEEAA